MVIQFDSLGYEGLGKTLAWQGWVEYFMTGPHREPLYPFLISLSMRLSDVFPLSYYKIQTFFQLCILLGSLFLSSRILQKLKISPPTTAITILYMGFSPAIVNTALSLYSEILTFPFILGIILLGTHAWTTLGGGETAHTIQCALRLGILFIGVTLIKGIYEYIFVVFLLPFLYRLLWSFLSRNKAGCAHLALFLILFIFTFQTAMIGYKALNKKYNDMFALTDSRADFSLYASAARRAEELSFRQILAGIAYTAGEGACRSFFREEECYFWSIHHYDSYGLTKLAEVSQEVPQEEVSSTMKSLAKGKVLEKPVQFAFLMGLEFVKMFFWESTKIGFVTYPSWLSGLYDFVLFKNALRLMVSLLSLFAFVYLWGYVIRSSHYIFRDPKKDILYPPIMFFLLLIITSHNGLYAIFMTIPRFALPLAPLYVLAITLAVKRMIVSRQKFLP
jgi:hypothetical protein